MINELLSIANHPSITDSKKIRQVYISCIYYLSKDEFKEFKHNTQKLLQLLISIGDLTLSSFILNLITKDAIQSSQEHIQVVRSNYLTSKQTIVYNYSITNNFDYIPNTLLQLSHTVKFYKKADLGAIILYTLKQHPNITSYDIQRLSQKYILFFPSLINSSDWDSRYSHGRSRFTIFVSELLRKAAKLNLVNITNNSNSSHYVYTLSEDGEQLVSYIEDAINSQLESAA